MNFFKIQGYLISRLIAVGGQAKVYEAIKNSNLYAIKVYDQKNQQSDECFKKQTQMIFSIQHPVLLSHSIYTQGETFMIENSNCIKKNIVIMPYMKNGDLMNQVIINGKIDNRIVLKIAKNILGCLIYLHKKDIFHCDIKPQNVLIDDNYQPKLIDFGFFSPKNNQTVKKCLKLYYIAPQIKKGMLFTQKSEAFSFGVMLFILLIGRLPFKATKHTDLSYRYLMQGKFKQFWKQFFEGSNQQLDEKIKITIQNLLEPNPKRRWSFSDILQSQWFKQQTIDEKQYIELFSKRQIKKQFLINQQMVTNETDIQEKHKIEPQIYHLY